MPRINPVLAYRISRVKDPFERSVRAMRALLHVGGATCTITQRDVIAAGGDPTTVSARPEAVTAEALRRYGAGRPAHRAA